MDSLHVDGNIQNKTKKQALLKLGPVSGQKGDWHSWLVGLKPTTGTC